ncbi:ceramidase domain-containing protein [Nitratireductor soli]|uniref:ceramidase domain-containing protein n=1 Tax=Nitratireductor soli TaxID=1670619 RepID=UPI00065E0163|nr:ceramidase domain-containing protein [Nitratireductor soli]
MSGELFAALDLYCERTGPEFWSEPINALSNLAFVAAGLWGVRAAQRNGAGRFAAILAWWVVVIGLGSGLFHTFANRMTAWADILPIVGFTFAYTLLNLHRFIGLRWSKAWLGLVAFYAAAGLVTALLPGWVHAATNNTTMYLPALLALLFFGGVEVATGRRVGWYNLAAAAIFVVSAACRIVDPAVCGGFPLGTHFLWHLFNGLMLGVLLAATARYGAPRDVYR